MKDINDIKMEKAMADSISEKCGIIMAMHDQIMLINNEKKELAAKLKQSEETRNKKEV
jgi:hypothetical protein